MTNKVISGVENKNQAIADELARIVAYAQMLGHLCELSPNAEPLSLEQLEVIFKDIAQVCNTSLDALKQIAD